MYNNKKIHFQKYLVVGIKMFIVYICKDICNNILFGRWHISISSKEYFYIRYSILVYQVV